MHLGHSLSVNTVTISPDSKYIVSGSYDNSIKVWDLLSGREVQTMTGKTYFTIFCCSIFVFNKSSIIIIIIIIINLSILFLDFIIITVTGIIIIIIIIIIIALLYYLLPFCAFAI